MFMRAEKTRKRSRDMLMMGRAGTHGAIATTSPDLLREIQVDMGVTSPKVYESGVITSLDLHLVNLYDACEVAVCPNPPTPVPTGEGGVNVRVLAGCDTIESWAVGRRTLRKAGRQWR